MPLIQCRLKICEGSEWVGAIGAAGVVFRDYYCAYETPSHVVNDLHITPLLALTLAVVAEE